MIPDAVSLSDFARKNMTLSAFFKEAYGPEGGAQHRNAQDNFVRSMAAYSVVGTSYNHPVCKAHFQMSFFITAKKGRQGRLVRGTDQRSVIEWLHMLSNVNLSEFLFVKHRFILFVQWLSICLHLELSLCVMLFRNDIFLQNTVIMLYDVLERSSCLVCTDPGHSFSHSNFRNDVAGHRSKVFCNVSGHSFLPIKCDSCCSRAEDKLTSFMIF